MKMLIGWLRAEGVRARRCGVGLPGCYLEEHLKEWFGKMTVLRWQEEKDMRQAKFHWEAAKQSLVS